MIVLEGRKLAIITPPHTASQNVQRALRWMCADPDLRAAWVMGPTPDGVSYDHHVVDLRNVWLEEGYTTALVVRHPLDRLVGLWKHWLHYWEKSHAGKESILQSFPRFVQAVADDDEVRLSWLFRYTIARLVGDRQIDRLIRFENLGADLAALLDVPVVLPPAYESAHADWRSYYDSAALSLAIDWARDDIERYGYSV